MTCVLKKTPTSQMDYLNQSSDNRLSAPSGEKINNKGGNVQKDYELMEYHPFTEKIVDAMQKKIPAAPKHMFRCLLAYFFCKAASTMRTDITTDVRGEIPVNAFLFNLAPSGIGKNYSVNTIEKNILDGFKKTFLEQVLPIVAEEKLNAIATQRAYATGEDPDTVIQGVISEYTSLGQMRFSFKKATSAAIQQLQQKLLMSGAGSMNLEIDEIGLNLMATSEALVAYLELFDVGEAKESLTKNTKENTRIAELEGVTPANLLAFGSPCKVFDGNKTEEAFLALEETGFARRSWTCYIPTASRENILTGAERYALQSSGTVTDVFKEASDVFLKLASVVNFGHKIKLTKEVGIEWLNYQADCELRAKPYIEIQETLRAEFEHRYFKALKLAGAFAFIDGNSEISMDNLHAAIRLAEDSGEHFYAMMHQDPPYAKMARYIANIPVELTISDLIEKLPYYKKASVPLRKDMMINAISWGYKNHIVIKDYLQDGIQFFKGSTLIKTDLNELKLAYSTDISDGYINDLAIFDKLHLLTQLKGYNWINHRTTNGHRDEDHMIPGFNLVVLDIDKNVKLETVHTLMKDYKYMTYTTKRHTNENHRFRLILPLNYEMNMNGEEYRKFMRAIYEWLPFEVDTSTVDRCRKWLTNDAGQYTYSKGCKLLDARLFIPKTKRNDERKQALVTHASLNNLERWFVANAPEGNRNNQILRYALILVDMGYSYEDIEVKLSGLNNSLADKLSQDELNRTVLRTVAKTINNRNTKQAA